MQGIVTEGVTMRGLPAPVSFCWGSSMDNQAKLSENLNLKSVS